jgi:hypothetical protein
MQLMSMAAPRHPFVRTRSGLFAYASFAVMVGGWVAFAVALVASQQTLGDVGMSVRDLSLLVEGVAWLVGFPFLIGLAIWETSWDEAARLVAIALPMAWSATAAAGERSIGEGGW